MKDDIRAAVIKTTTAVSLSTYAGLTLNEWAAVATIAYVILQAGFLIRDRLRGVSK